MSNKWNEHPSPNNTCIAEKLINLEFTKTLFYSTDYEMVQYSLQNNEHVRNIQYPKEIQPKYHCCCSYDQNGRIYIIDGYNQCAITSFYPSNKKYKPRVRIPKIGMRPSAVQIFGKIHIFHGDQNNGKHIIYDIIMNKISTCNDKGNTDKMSGVSTLLFNDRIIRFGGFNHTKPGWDDRFMISNKIVRDKEEGITWTIKPEFKLKKPTEGCGSILYGHYIIIFGGDGHAHGAGSDTISVLDLNESVGWIELNRIKCPARGQFAAILTGDMVHLIGRCGCLGHWSLSVKTILESRSIEEKEEKEEKEENKCSKGDKLKTNLNKIKSEKLKQELNEQNEEECKELNSENIKKEIDIKNYKEWDTNQLLDWIYSIDDGHWMFYEDPISYVFKNDGIDGSSLDMVNKTELQDAGMDPDVCDALVAELDWLVDQD